MWSKNVMKWVWLLAFSCLLFGCGSYPKVTSRESLDFIKQVYTACNTRNSTRLAECEKQLVTMTNDGKIGTVEADAFRKLIDLAKNDRWEEAQNVALKFAQDQIR